MSLIKRNVIANLAGNGWSALLSIIVIPVYIYFIGIEAYGLIGISVMFFSLFSILDMGMTVTLGRELARLSALPGKVQEARDLVRSLEIPVWLIALLLGTVMITASHTIAHDWLKTGKLPLQTVQYAVILMGVSIALQWPSSFYISGLNGLQHQILLNAITAGMATFRCIGTILVLWLISPTLNAFFAWQILASFVQTSILALFLWEKIPSTGVKSQFQTSLLKGTWHFTAGAGGSSIAGLLISQMDKIILSKLLSLEMFGYYSLASTAATSFSRLISPLVIAVYPRMVQLVALHDTVSLRRLYHVSCQLMSVIIIPVSLIMVFFPKEILLIWTQDLLTAQKTYLIMVLLTIATLINGLSHLSLSLQYANGRVKAIFFISFIVMLVMAVTIYAGTKMYGVYGAAVGLVAVHISYTLSLIHIIHRQSLPGELGLWYTQDVGRPLFAALAVTLIGRIILDPITNIWIMLIGILVTALVSIIVTSMSTLEVRRLFIQYINGFRERTPHVI
ncbi:MAG: oligosaccharide flippase family protein [Deltaproteobacteria bacterium]|nr:oligosaccharide flippase family protein [Deltaproteobacteria bacterium]